MYSDRVTQAAQERLEVATGVKLVRYDRPKREDFYSHLDGLFDEDTEQPARPLTKEEREFIRNERLLAMLDFDYWTFCCKIIHDKGGITRLKLWGAQEVALAKIARIEEAMIDAFARGEPVDGILICQHKARQLGATAFSRALVFHRITTAEHTRAITASIDDEKIDAIVLRDKRILENLPWWMRPSVGYDTKGGHLFFDKLDSSLIYQTYSQVSGLGQGEAFEVGHMTECGNILSKELEHNFFPTIPQSTASLHILESTAQGRGNWWHEFVTNVLDGNMRRWNVIFTPWYSVDEKYKAHPPPDWNPSEITLLHAQRVWDTSFDYIGKKVMLSKQQLYWWETTRAEYAKSGSLANFLTNFCATISESFQHREDSAFSVETLDHLRNNSRSAAAYEVMKVAENA